MAIYNNIATNLYVATNGSSITQIAVTLESEPLLYIRCKINGTYNFTPWYYIPSKIITDKISVSVLPTLIISPL
jgi:hypothetical protein